MIRAVSFLSRYQDLYANKRELLGPNIIANYELGAKLTLADFAWAHAEQTRIFRRFQEIYKDYDLVIGPTVGFTPFPWKQLYIDEMDGKKLNNYYHWMATKYFVTLTTNPVGLAALRPRPQEDAVRPAGRSAASAATARCWAPRTPWSWRSRPSPASPGRCPTSAKLREAHAGAEVDRDPSAEARRQGGARTRRPAAL